MKRTIIVGAALVLALTGCSSDEQPAGAEGGPVSESPTASGEPEAGEPAQDAPESEASTDGTDAVEPASLGEPVASREASASGYRMRVDVLPVERRGSLADLNFTLTLLAGPQGQDDPSLQIAGLFSDGNSDSVDSSGFAVDGVRLMDGTNAKVHLPASDGAGACLCTRELSSTFLRVDDTIVLSASYAAPPEGVDTVSVIVPKFGTFTDVPVR